MQVGNAHPSENQRILFFLGLPKLKWLSALYIFLICFQFPFICTSCFVSSHVSAFLSNSYNPILQKAVGSFGLNGLDRLLSFMIVRELQNFQILLQKGILRDKNAYEMISSLSKSLHPIRGLVSKFFCFTIYFHTNNCISFSSFFFLFLCWNLLYPNLEPSTKEKLYLDKLDNTLVKTLLQNKDENFLYDHNELPQNFNQSIT